MVELKCRSLQLGSLSFQGKVRSKARICLRFFQVRFFLPAAAPPIPECCQDEERKKGQKVRDKRQQQINSVTQMDTVTHHECGVFERRRLCCGLCGSSRGAVSCSHRLHLSHRLHCCYLMRRERQNLFKQLSLLNLSYLYHTFVECKQRQLLAKHSVTWTTNIHLNDSLSVTLTIRPFRFYTARFLFKCALCSFGEDILIRGKKP